MKTRVVNIRLDKYDVYGGRNHKGQVPDEVGAEGWLGNPFPLPPRAGVSKRAWEAEVKRVLEQYRDYFLRRVAEDPEFAEAVLACRGKAIGCFCVNAKGEGECHLRTVVEWIEAQPCAHSDAYADREYGTAFCRACNVEVERDGDGWREKVPPTRVAG